MKAGMTSYFVMSCILNACRNFNLDIYDHNFSPWMLDSGKGINCCWIWQFGIVVSRGGPNDILGACEKISSATVVVTSLDVYTEWHASVQCIDHA